MKEFSSEKYPNPEALRARAESVLSQQPEVGQSPSEDAAALIHELRVHQTELEMQNEELRRAQHELEESHSRVRDLYEFAPVGYVTMDRMGTIMDANHTIAGMLGTSSRHLKQSNLTEFIAPQGQDAFYFHRSAVFDQRALHSCEVQMKPLQGEELVVRLESVVAGEHPGPEQVASCRTALIDITHRKAAEADQARLASLVTSSPVAFVGLGLDGTIEHWNPGAVQLFGYTEEEARGWNISMLYPASLRSQLPKVLDTLRRGKAIKDFETVRMHKDGTLIDVALTLSPIKDAVGEINGISGILLDIRERRRLEREIIVAAESEQRRIAMELHDSLGSRLTAVHWHLSGFGRGLEKTQSKTESQEALAIANELRDAIAHLRDLTQGLQPLGDDPSELIHALLELANQADASGRLSCHFLGPNPQADPLPILGSGTCNQLLRIAQEAVHNAMRHSGATQATIELQWNRDHLTLRVSDNGCGFDPFAVRNAGRRTLGIGTMQHRSQMIGGRLNVQSRPEGGTDVVCEC